MNASATASEARALTPAQRADLAAAGYLLARLLPSGEIAGLTRMIYTVALCVGIDAESYRTRFCYPDVWSAMNALARWCGEGDPPGPWIKNKGGADRPNPHYLKGIPIVTEYIP